MSLDIALMTKAMRFEWTVRAMKQLVHFCGCLTWMLEQELCCSGTGTPSSEHSGVSESFPESEMYINLNVDPPMKEV